MTRKELCEAAEKFTRESPDNYISEEIAISPECAGMKIYDAPIFAFGAPDDELYEKYKEPGIIGEHFMPPAEWLEGVKTVISFFAPYTEEIKLSNSQNYDWPSDKWLHARIEGQKFTDKLLLYICGLLSDAGYKSLAPALDPRFKRGVPDADSAEKPFTAADPRFRRGARDTKYTSNWSERHVAFACGLGTFSLSRGLITPKGICGRIGVALTQLDLPKDKREYTEIYEYCIMCGACVRHCPAHCISLENGKEHAPCGDFLDSVFAKHNPRYGCGKCQVGVPCASRIPKKTQGVIG